MTAIPAPASAPERLYSVDDVAEYLGVAPLKVYKLLQAGDLRAIRVGNRWRVPASALTEFVAAGGAR